MSSCSKPADIDNNMGLLVGLTDFCYLSNTCVHQSGLVHMEGGYNILSSNEMFTLTMYLWAMVAQLLSTRLSIGRM